MSKNNVKSQVSELYFIFTTGLRATYNVYRGLQGMGLNELAKMKFLGLEMGLKMGLKFPKKLAANAEKHEISGIGSFIFLSEQLSSFFFCFRFHNCYVQLVAAGN